MKRALEEALTACLARMEAGSKIEDCLRDHGAIAGELRPLLEAAQALRSQQGRIPAHTPAAFHRGRTRMHTARALQAEGGRRRPWAGFFGRPAAVVAVGTVAAVLAVLAFTTGLLQFDADTTSAAVQGVVSRVDRDAIQLTTVDGRLDIRIAEDTVVLDASGNTISGVDIVPGRPAEIEVKEEEDGEFSARRIEVKEDSEIEAGGTEVEFSGVVQTVSGDTITVKAPFGLATVHTNVGTEFKDTVFSGAFVEVRATLRDDGSYLAREIRVEERHGDDDGDDDDDEEEKD